YRSMDRTARGLGLDEPNYKSLVQDFVAHWEDLFAGILAPWRPIRHPLVMAGFGLRAVRSARTLGHAFFRTEKARALLAGLAGHSMLPLETLTSSAPALALAVAGHAVGWPFARGGAQQLTQSLVSYFKSLGGELVTGHLVRSFKELSPARAILLDVTPRQLLAMAGDQLPG